MSTLPTGTVTFLFTEIEGAAALLQRLGERRYAEVLDQHLRLLRAVFAEGRGQEVDSRGTSCVIAFPKARDALAAAVAAQRALLGHGWPDGASPRVRMGLHTGEPIGGTTGYVGIDVHRAARIAAAAHGGQILVSDTTRGLVARVLPEGVTLRDLGEHRLKDLAHPHRLFQAVAPDLPAEFPPLRTLDAVPHNLPVQLTSLVGREREVAEVKGVLAEARLVTLTGAGGAGKTRLALQVAAEAVEGYPDGVWHAEFGPIAEPALVPKIVASALSVPEQSGRDMSDTLVDVLRTKALLLVLDNCEHLLPACADLAAALLRRCPPVRILATSRQPLGVPGETVWRVPSLSVPRDIDHLPPSEELILYDAVRLFADRAAAVAPDFRVTGENGPAVAQVCRRLDGIPLAIELAAARVKVLAVEQLAARLDDRFRLLTGGSRMVLPRQQTLRAAIDWSYRLLSKTERVLLPRLSVFAGGWTLEGAEAVGEGGDVEAGAVLDVLAALVDKSLVVAETLNGAARYRFLETIRAYGRDRLQESGEADEVRRRHRDWYLELAERADAELRGPNQDAWLDRLEMEHDNMRAALAWARTDKAGVDAWLRLAAALAWFWNIDEHWSEGRLWLDGALAHSGGAHPSILLRILGAARRLAFQQGDYDRTRELCERSLTLARTLGDKQGTARALLGLGNLAEALDDRERAAALLEESVALSYEVGDKWLIGFALQQLADCARARGDYERAARLGSESIALCREVGDKWRVAVGLRAMGILSLRKRDYERAAEFYTESLKLCLQRTNRWVSFHGVEGMGCVASARGHDQRAARLFGAAEALREALRSRRDADYSAEVEQYVRSARMSLGVPSFEAAWAEGRAMTARQAIEYALARETV